MEDLERRGILELGRKLGNMFDTPVRDRFFLLGLVSLAAPASRPPRLIDESSPEDLVSRLRLLFTFGLGSRISSFSSIKLSLVTSGRATAAWVNLTETNGHFKLCTGF